jgi:hypothetical protein
MHPNFVRHFRATRFMGGVEGKARFGISGGLFLLGRMRVARALFSVSGRPALNSPPFERSWVSRSPQQASVHRF